MRHFTPSILKDFLSGGILTGGFTLISIGVGTIAGTGAGLIVGGCLAVAFQQWWTKSG